MAIIKVNWSSLGDGGEVFCPICSGRIGVLSWDEIKFLSQSRDEIECFNCEVIKACDLYPSLLVMALEDAWRLVIGNMVFYGEWADCAAPGGVMDDRFLIPWGEMLIREQAKDGEFLELPKSWFEGGNGLNLPCLVSANLKLGDDLGDYCEA